MPSSEKGSLKNSVSMTSTCCSLRILGQINLSEGVLRFLSYSEFHFDSSFNFFSSPYISVVGNNCPIVLRKFVFDFINPKLSTMKNHRSFDYVYNTKQQKLKIFTRMYTSNTFYSNSWKTYNFRLLHTFIKGQ